MIVFDRNVICEPFRSHPNTNVVSGLAACPGIEKFTFAIARGKWPSRAHIRPTGQRKDDLLARMIRLFED